MFVLNVHFSKDARETVRSNHSTEQISPTRGFCGIHLTSQRQEIVSQNNPNPDPLFFSRLTMPSKISIVEERSFRGRGSFFPPPQKRSQEKKEGRITSSYGPDNRGRERARILSRGSIPLSFSPFPNVVTSRGWYNALEEKERLFSWYGRLS